MSRIRQDPKVEAEHLLAEFQAELGPRTGTRNGKQSGP